MTNTTHGDFQPGDTVRVKADVTLNDGVFANKTGVVNGRVSNYYVYVDVGDMQYNNPVPFVVDEIEHASQPAPADILRAQADVFTAEAAEADRQRAELARRVIELDEKSMASRRLATQYRNVASDLEARG